jgi:hypothetical protein
MFVSDQDYSITSSTATSATLQSTRRAHGGIDAPSQIVITWPTAAKKPANLSVVGIDVRVRIEDI